MKKLLCVDDEEWVLDFLRLSLKALNEEWEMEFVLSAEEALKRLAQATYDVVLSDIHLPGMSGIQLFYEVKGKYPQTIRIAFSGAADQTTVTHALKIAHQVLPKPVTPAMLRASIDRARALRDQVCSEAVERLVKGIRHMPTIPALYEELLGVLQAQESSAEKVAQVIAKDPGMTANLLRVANSIPFTMRNRVESPAQAVAMLGIENVKSMVLGFKVCHDNKKAGINQPEVEEVWRHGFAVATHARTIASVENVGSLTIENAFLAGLLHDVGRLVLLTNLPGDYKKAMALVNMEHVSISQAEREVFGATHSQLGAYLLGKWGLRDAIVEAVAFHHEPMLCSQPGFSILAAIHMANVWDREATNPYGDPPGFDKEFMTQTGLLGKVPIWRESHAA
ncbi:MAG: response regulator [Nitrospiraceae bacterium]